MHPGSGRGWDAALARSSTFEAVAGVRCAMTGGFERLCARILTDGRLLVPLLVANALGMAFGWYYYHDVGQFDPGSPYFTHPGWWALVADSPNALALFVVAVLLRHAARRNRWFDAFALALNVYVGIWTTFLFLAYADRMATFEGGTNTLLFVTHMGMPLQALLLAPSLRRDVWRPREVLLVLAALAAYVAIDYWGPHLHPAPFLHVGPGDRLLHAVSPWLMVPPALLFVALAFPWRRTRQGVSHPASRQTP
jgi:uncharacterized membrane protein YpjA